MITHDKLLLKINENKSENNQKRKIRVAFQLFIFGELMIKKITLCTIHTTLFFSKIFWKIKIIIWNETILSMICLLSLRQKLNTLKVLKSYIMQKLKMPLENS